MDGRGWPDIAYTFLINDLGQIFEGVPPGYLGTHTAGHNSTGHAICLLGDFNTDTPTPAALASLVSLIDHGHAKGWWPGKLTGGHRDTRGAASGDCPGNKLYNLIPHINQETDMELTEENYKRIGEAVLFKTFSDPVSGGVRGIAHHIVQGYKQATDAAIAARAASESAAIAANQATAAVAQTTKTKLIAAVVAAGTIGAAAGPTAADIVAEIGRLLSGG
jgi:hypothetical protein